MKHFNLALVIVNLLLNPIFFAFSWAEDKPKEIMVEIGDGSAAGDAIVKAIPLAKGGGTSMHTADKQLISVITCDYLVDKEVKFIMANYVIYTGQSTSPIRRTVILPIQQSNGHPIKTHVDGNFNAFAVIKAS